MVQITRAEMEALRQHSLRRFDDGLIEHIAQYFPKRYRLMGVERARSLVAQGREAARVYGLESEREVYLYASLMLYLGSGFDTDPQLPWAHASLTDSGMRSPWQRIETAFDEGLDYMDRVLGVETELLQDAARRVPQGLHDLIAASSVGEVLDALHRVYPQKCESTGHAGLLTLVERARTCATTHKIQTRRGTAALLLCMLMAGHGVDRDLQFHWVAEALAGADGAASGDRAQRLCDALLAAVPVWWLSD